MPRKNQRRASAEMTAEPKQETWAYLYSMYIPSDYSTDYTVEKAQNVDQWNLITKISSSKLEKVQPQSYRLSTSTDERITNSTRKKNNRRTAAGIVKYTQQKVNR